MHQTKAANTNGKTKCEAKNLLGVALFTEKPPHINSTISCLVHSITALFRLSEIRFELIT